MELKFNVGAGEKPIDGYINLDMGADVHLSTIRDADLIYSSHFFEYFDKVEAMELLKSWHRALKDGGELFISVPDFAEIVKIYQAESIIMDGALYGKMPAYIDASSKDGAGKIKGSQPIYHKAVYDRKTLREALLLAGFRNVSEFEPFHDDCSQDPISLNLKCRK